MLIMNKKGAICEYIVSECDLYNSEQECGRDQIKTERNRQQSFEF